MKRFEAWSQRKSSPGQQVATLALAGALIVIVLPLGVAFLAAWLDASLGLANFAAAPLTPALGAVCVVGGLALALWAIQVQLTIGEGTPVPTAPTQRLIDQPPFAYCRNPMALGTIIAYTGFAILLGSWTALGIVAFLSGLLIAYIKLIEEKELAMRFGASYLAYKQATPFMIPRLRRPRS
jgi:protein-S-isoprenylcysteine O-methyltransferase Ste14